MFELLVTFFAIYIFSILLWFYFYKKERNKNG